MTLKPWWLTRSRPLARPFGLPVHVARHPSRSIHGALDHLDHVIDLAGVGAGDEGGSAPDELFIGLTGCPIAPCGSALLLKPIG
ncbi:MAG: hypothetical protein H0X73_11620 [Chthoniobacterales bacterium]|nr:hypothetical protein [Chthoniobacterales bacterium]